MKLVICLMGMQCSGIYLMENYLVDAYGFKRYKGYTTRKRRKDESDEAYHFVDVDFLHAKDRDLISLRQFNGDFYAKKLSEIPYGFSVSITDYDGYLQLKEKVTALPIFLDRGLKYRYKSCQAVGDISHDCFLNRDFHDSIQFEMMKIDKEVVKIKYRGLNNTFLTLDTLIFPMLDEIKKYNRLGDNLE